MKWIASFFVSIGMAISSLFGGHSQPAQPAANSSPSVQTSTQTSANPASNSSQTSASTPTSSAISVSGMQEYSDSNFNFSFWYPNNWPIKNVAVLDPTQFGGTVSKTLAVGASTPSEIDIYEVYSPKGVTVSSNLNAVTYYFDATAHTWMTYSVNDPTATAADVSTNTMGGLHMLSTPSAFYPTVIPLSASNFLVIGDPQAGISRTIPFAKTILSNDPYVATPESAALQEQTIQAEENAYVSASPASSSSASAPIITSISASSAVPGTEVTIFGSNFSTTGANLITLYSSALVGLGSSANIPGLTTSNSSQLTFTAPSVLGSYKLTVEANSNAGGPTSNSVPFTVTSPCPSTENWDEPLGACIGNSSNATSTYTDSNFGFSFGYPSTWTLTKNAAGNIITLGNTDQYNDNINIEEVPGNTVTTTSGKFGSVTYTYENGQMMTSGVPNSETGQGTPGTATPIFYTGYNWPVYQGTSSWKTDVVYIPGKGFLIVDSGGSGYTANLDPLVKGIVSTPATVNSNTV